MLIHSSSFSFFNLHNHHHHHHHHHLSKKEKMLMYSSNFSFDNPAAAWVTKQCNQDDKNLRLRETWSCFVHRFDLLVPTLLFLQLRLHLWKTECKSSATVSRLSKYRVIFVVFPSKLQLASFYFFPLQKYHCLKLQTASYKDLSPTEWRGPSILFCFCWKCICICF